MTLFVSLVMLFSSVPSAFADQYVNGYYRSNGTYVNGYYRSSPDSSPYNNFSYPGNTNPYTGVTAGGNTSTYLKNYGSGSSYTSSYTPSTYYTPPVSSYKSNSDCPSYGFAYLGSCYELPSHANKSYFSGFTCDYGYDEVGYGLTKKCLPEVDHGTRIGTSIFCDYGYSLSYDSCIKKSESNTNYYGAGTSASSYGTTDTYSCPKNSSTSDTDATKCTCDVGYEITKNKDACKKISKSTNDKICRADFGRYSYWNGKYDTVEEAPLCQCKKKYEWSEDGTECVKEKK